MFSGSSTCYQSLFFITPKKVELFVMDFYFEDFIVLELL